MSELSKEQVHGLAIRLVAAIRNRSFRVGHDVIEWEERIYGEDARIAELVLKDFGITGAEGPPPRAETEIERLRQQRDEMLAALTAFANWRMPTVRDWECGALRDEFKRMQRTARAVIAKATGAQS